MKLNNKQIEWLESNKVNYRNGFFSKNDLFLDSRPVGGGFYLMMLDRSEDGDGEKQVGVFDTLKDALRKMVAVA